MRVYFKYMYDRKNEWIKQRWDSRLSPIFRLKWSIDRDVIQVYDLEIPDELYKDSVFQWRFWYFEFDKSKVDKDELKDAAEMFSIKIINSWQAKKFIQENTKLEKDGEWYKIYDEYTEAGVIVPKKVLTIDNG